MPDPSLATRLRNLGTETALAVAAWLTGNITLLILLFLLPSDLRTSDYLVLLGGPLATGVALFGLRWVLNRANGADLEGLPAVPPVFGEQPSSVAKSLLITAIAAAAAVGGSLALFTGLQALGIEIDEQPRLVAIVGDGSWRPVLITMAVLVTSVVPALEEAFFRGLLFHRIWHRGGPALAYLASSGFFALVHGNPAGIPVYMWLGVCFAAAYQFSGRLWCAVIVHGINNGLTLLLLIYG